MSYVYVAIGSNINPEGNIAKAVRELQRLFPDARFSSWYRNRAVGFDGDDFVNGVVGFTTDIVVGVWIGNDDDSPMGQGRRLRSAR